MIVKSNPIKKSLKGRPVLPGDKSISHRSLIIPALANGITTVTNILESDDVNRTKNSLMELGVKIEKNNNKLIIYGRGLNSLKKPKNKLYLGNSGTSARLLIGLLANQSFSSIIIGDESLSQRPMDRIINPLKAMGANFEFHNNTLPITIHGNKNLKPINMNLDIPSAQIKSGVLFAGLNTEGITTISENFQTRDHTEIMLKTFGADIEVKNNNGNKKITLKGRKDLKPCDIIVPIDFSSASFFIVAALLIEGSEITLKNLNLNPKRTGLLKALNLMGAKIKINNKKNVNGEIIGDLNVCYSKLKGCTLNNEIAPTMIDEYPILSIAASFATTPSQFFGLNELKIKESNRLSSIHENLNKCGIKNVIGKDNIVIYPTKNIKEEVIKINSKKDHRIAMSFIIFGMISKKGIVINEAEYIKTSFPNFITNMNKMGAEII